MKDLTTTIFEGTTFPGKFMEPGRVEIIPTFKVAKEDKKSTSGLTNDQDNWTDFGQGKGVGLFERKPAFPDKILVGRTSSEENENESESK